ncbi:hypothetical protein CWE12_03215 [Aliidiomarina sedimenti]|uniref:Guanylate cyclase domain-containing protein n=1 Tax=Aliidiomarina sedimenti TaxID=1933879 RepID=A0ABY0C343_9GAMM|nr:hypothetical protein [Aliidiomarina sedimenti]RUO32012.1 hypothetical protein CWE12_03215 [Aliidiomarina sedimenti]
MIAVLTGDLVHSSKLSEQQLNQAQQLLQQQINRHTQSGGRGELYRGDAFQLALPEARDAIKAALLVVCTLRANGVALTLSVGIGDGPVAKRSATAQQQAYVLSGRGLELTSRGELTVHSDHSAANQSLQLNTAFLSFLLQNLTRKQAEVLYDWVNHDFCEHHLVAERLQTSRQNVSLHLRKLGGHLVESYCQTFAQWLTDLPSAQNGEPSAQDGEPSAQDGEKK